MTRTISIKTYLKFGLLGLLFVFIGLYSLFQVKALAKGVDLEVKGIEDGAVLDHNTVQLKGLALHANHITINDKEVHVDKESNFSEELVLSPGYNIIAIEAQDKFNKKTEKIYRVFYKIAPEAGVIDTTISTNQ